MSTPPRSKIWIVWAIFIVSVALATAWVAWFALRRVDLAHPWFLFAALAAPLAAYWSYRGTGRVVFSSLRAIPAHAHTWRTRLAWVPDLLMSLAVLALAIALAGPRTGDETSRIHREGIAIMMAVDTSGSMRAEDLGGAQQLTRLDAIKEVFERFVLGGNGLRGRPDDAIGLVAFARYADTRSPLTLDHANLTAALHRLTFAPEDEDGTAIGAGLALAVERVGEMSAASKIKSRVVILLTDGKSNIHDIDEDAAIDDVVAKGIKVYTVGAGTTGVAPIKVDRGDGRMEYVHMQVDIDEDLLRKIAEKTGGQYFRATDHGSLAQIYKQIDRLERTSIEEAQFARYDEYYPYFLAAALGLVALALLARGTFLRRLP